MRLEWDEQKNIININKHGLDFADAKKLFEQPLLVRLDTRYAYLEDRYIGLGLINKRLMVVVFTKRPPNIIRIISLRKANQREQKKFSTYFPN